MADLRTPRLREITKSSYTKLTLLEIEPGTPAFNDALNLDCKIIEAARK